MKEDLDCKEMSQLMSAGRDLVQPPQEQARMRRHLVICETCRNVNDQFDFLSRAMRQLGKPQEAGEPVAK